MHTPFRASQASQAYFQSTGPLGTPETLETFETFPEQTVWH